MRFRGLELITLPTKQKFPTSPVSPKPSSRSKISASAIEDGWQEIGEKQEGAREREKRKESKQGVNQEEEERIGEGEKRKKDRRGEGEGGFSTVDEGSGGCEKITATTGVE